MLIANIGKKNVVENGTFGITKFPCQRNHTSRRQKHATNDQIAHRIETPVLQYGYTNKQPRAMGTKPTSNLTTNCILFKQNDCHCAEVAGRNGRCYFELHLLYVWGKSVFNGAHVESGR